MKRSRIHTQDSAYVPTTHRRQQIIHQVVEVAVVRELDMSTDVPGKTMVVYERRSEATRARILVEYSDSDLADLRQTAGRTQTSWPSAENDHGLISKVVHSLFKV